MYGRPLGELGKDANRLDGLLDVLLTPGSTLDLVRGLEVEDLRLLILVVRAALDERDLTQDMWKLVSDLIGGLSSFPSSSSTDALHEMFGAPGFAGWLPNIAGAIAAQAAKRRDSEFRHCGIEEVTRMLDNGRPANAADLAAVVVAEICHLSGEIRDGSASHWKHLWNVGSYNNVIKPRPEESCRDVILFALQSKLGRLEIDLQPEGTYANRKRSDIRAEYGGSNVADFCFAAGGV